MLPVFITILLTRILTMIMENTWLMIFSGRTRKLIYLTFKPYWTFTTAYSRYLSWKWIEGSPHNHRERRWWIIALTFQAKCSSQEDHHKNKEWVSFYLNPLNEARTGNISPEGSRVWTELLYFLFLKRVADDPLNLMGNNTK